MQVKSHPKVTSCLRLFLSAQRLQETESGLDVHTESTHKGIDFLGDRFEEMEEVLFVCVCVWERERERECVCVTGENIEGESVCVCYARMESTSCV